MLGVERFLIEKLAFVLVREAQFLGEAGEHVDLPLKVIDLLLVLGVSVEHLRTLSLLNAVLAHLLQLIEGLGLLLDSAGDFKCLCLHQAKAPLDEVLIKGELAALL